MTQRAVVERLLKERGSTGVGARELNYQHGITRSAAIVHVLRQEGWSIRTEGDPGEMARYVLGNQKGSGRPVPAPEPPSVAVVLQAGTCLVCERGHGRHLAAIAAGAFPAHDWQG